MGHTKRPAAAWHGDNQRQRRHRLGSDLAGVSPRMAGRCHQHWRVPSDHLGLKVGIRRRPAVHHAKVDRAAQQRLGGSSELPRISCKASSVRASSSPATVNSWRLLWRINSGLADAFLLRPHTNVYLNGPAVKCGQIRTRITSSPTLTA